MTWWWFFMYFGVANKTTMHTSPFFKGSNDLCTRFPLGQKRCAQVLGNNLWGGRMVLLEPFELPRGFILWVCDSNFFGEVITPPPVPAKLAWLLPGWPSKRGCPGQVPALESQLAEGLLDWLASSPELLAQAGVALLSWGSWLHGAALRFTNKQEARPLPPCWG